MRTKIVATIGPASCAPEKIAQLAEAGVSVFRLNFSHGDPEFFRKVITAIREVEKNIGRPLQSPRERERAFLCTFSAYRACPQRKKA